MEELQKSWEQKLAESQKTHQVSAVGGNNVPYYWYSVSYVYSVPSNICKLHYTLTSFNLYRRHLTYPSVYMCNGIESPRETILYRL